MRCDNVLLQGYMKLFLHAQPYVILVCMLGPETNHFFWPAGRLDVIPVHDPWTTEGRFPIRSVHVKRRGYELSLAAGDGHVIGFRFRVLILFRLKDRLSNGIPPIVHSTRRPLPGAEPVLSS